MVYHGLSWFIIIFHMKKTYYGYSRYTQFSDTSMWVTRERIAESGSTQLGGEDMIGAHLIIIDIDQQYKYKNIYK